MLTLQTFVPACLEEWRPVWHISTRPDRELLDAVGRHSRLSVGSVQRSEVGSRATPPVVDFVSEEQWLRLVLAQLGPEDSLGHTPPPS